MVREQVLGYSWACSLGGREQSRGAVSEGGGRREATKAAGGRSWEPPKCEALPLSSGAKFYCSGID